MRMLGMLGMLIMCRPAINRYSPGLQTILVTTHPFSMAGVHCMHCRVGYLGFGMPHHAPSPHVWDQTVAVAWYRSRTPARDPRHGAELPGGTLTWHQVARAHVVGACCGCMWMFESAPRAAALPWVDTASKEAGRGTQGQGIIVRGK